MRFKKQSRFIEQIVLMVLGVIAGPLVVNAQVNHVPEDYAGKPFTPHDCIDEIQSIPGRIELSWYDLGGEGIAYHDNDATNNGTDLNRQPDRRPVGVPDRIAFFREKEGVDMIYIKSEVDFIRPNLVIPKVNQHYIGWQEDGEWTNYTVDVKVAGKYRIVALYSNKDNNSNLYLNNEFAVRLVLPEETGYWHIWNKAVVGEMFFPEPGLNLLTLKYNEGANLAYLDFILVTE